MDGTSSNYTKLGDNINGTEKSERFGTCVSLSADGSTLAIGAPKGFKNENTNVTGRVQVLSKWNGLTWDASHAVFGEEDESLFGASVSLSAGGNFVAIGVPNGVGSRELKGDDGHVIRTSGEVQMFKWNGFMWDNWGIHLNGTNITKEHCADDTSISLCAGDNFGSSVSLSADAMTLAIGSSKTGGRRGLVQIYKRVSNASSWEPTDQTFIGEEPGDEFGSAVALSAGGRSVAIGAPFLNNGKDKWSGSARVFDLRTTCTAENTCEEGQFCNFVVDGKGFCEACPATKKCNEMGLPEAVADNCVALCEKPTQ